MGIHLRGRDFSWADWTSQRKVAVINASSAQFYWPGEDAVGKILMRGPEQDRVIGVVDDVHEEHVESGAGSQIYYPVTQQGPSSAQLVIRTSLPPSALTGAVFTLSVNSSQTTGRRISPHSRHRGPRCLSAPFFSCCW